MPVTSEMSVEVAPPSSEPWWPVELRGPKLKPSGGGLVHSYTTDAKLLPESDWVYLQIAYAAYQIHPIGWDELAQFGAFDSRDMQRWSWEGPTSHRPGDPYALDNCKAQLEVAFSLDTAPGSTWVQYRPGRYRLRSVQARLTITRPSTAYDFRVTRFSLLVHRAAEPQVLRKVHAGVVDRIPAGMSRVAVRDFEVAAGATLEIESNGYLEVLT